MDDSAEKLLAGADIAHSNDTQLGSEKGDNGIETRARARTNSITSSLTADEKKEAAMNAI